jgi:hypothetical protein
LVDIPVKWEWLKPIATQPRNRSEQPMSTKIETKDVYILFRALRGLSTE